MPGTVAATTKATKAAKPKKSEVTLIDAVVVGSAILSAAGVKSD